MKKDDKSLSSAESAGSIDPADSIVITDRTSRRRFMRAGSAFLLGGATVSAALAPVSQALASDCDQGGGGEKTPEDAGNGSDSDAGSGADPRGCGRRYHEKPKISRLMPDVDHPAVDSASVARVAVVKG